MSTKAETTVEATAPVTDEGAPPQKGGNGLAVMEAAALLTIWSLLVINEGAIRFNGLVVLSGNAPNTYDDFSFGRPALGVRFFASLGEVIFGFAGLFVGISAFIYRAYSTVITKAAMVLQAVLGWFIFLVYVFIIPAYKAADATDGTTYAGMSLGLFRFLITLGIFTSFHFCLALQGGQFVFFARLVAAATGEDFLKQMSGMKMRAMFWSGNLALSGLWVTITGAILISEVTGGRTEKPFEFPPNVGRLPTLLLVTGLVMLVVGLMCFGAAALNVNVPMAFYALVGAAFLFTWLNFTIVQFGFVPAPGGGPVAMHAGLVFMLYFLGPYFLFKQTRDKGMVPEPEYAV